LLRCAAGCGTGSRRDQPLSSPVPHEPVEGRTPHWSSPRCREHEPVGTGRVQPDVLGEGEGDEVGDGAPAPRAVGLGFTRDEVPGLDDLFLDTHTAARKVQAIKPQGDELAPSKRPVGGQKHESPVAVRESLDQTVDLRHAENPGPGLLDLRCLDAGGGVSHDGLAVHRSRQESPHDLESIVSPPGERRNRLRPQRREFVYVTGTSEGTDGDSDYATGRTGRGDPPSATTSGSRSRGGTSAPSRCRPTIPPT